MNTKILLKKREIGDGTFELEQQLLLRLPPGPAMTLRQDVQTGSIALKDKLSIEFQNDMRRGYVRYGKDIFNAKLLDLPCVTESLKTIDRKTYYKTADVCQMLRCTEEDESSQDENDSPIKKKEKDKRFFWNHGITPPMKNVRKRRFRKTLKKKYMEQPDIEKEVKRLFRADAEAMDVKWEVIVEDDKSLSESNTGASKSHIEASGTAENTRAALMRTDTQASFDIPVDEQDLFGELSSLDEDEDDEKDINIMDSGDEDTPKDPMSPSQQLDTFDLGGTEEQEMDTNTAELQKKLTELVVELETIKAKKKIYEEQMAVLDNESLKMRVQESVDKLTQEESEKEKEFEILSAVLGE